MGIDLRTRYAGTLAGRWARLSRTLAALDTVAADPARLDRDALELLPRLQYELHWASELLVGVDAPPGAGTAHRELGAALVDARDATAEVAEAIELGGREAAAALVPEWRGAIFRVRLARLRIAGARATSRSAAAPPAPPRGAAAASALVLAGAAGFAGGALLGVWPLWAAGLALIACALLAYRS